MSGHIEPVNAAWMSHGAGIFSWDIEANRFYGDDTIASYFGMDARETKQGLPLQEYLTRLHADDRAKAARTLHHTIITGEPCQEEYRIVQEDGSLIWILAMGHCFRSKEGSPSSYAGVIYDITEQKTTRTDGISDHCHAALFVAKKLHNDRLVHLLEDAITEAGEEDLRGALRASMRH